MSNDSNRPGVWRAKLIIATSTNKLEHWKGKSSRISDSVLFLAIPVHDI